MLVIKNHGFKRQCVYGGAGIFDSIVSFFSKLFASIAVEQIASTALHVGKNAAKEVQPKKKAVDIGKTDALDTV